MKIVKNKNFWEASGPSVGGSKHSHINLKSEITKLKWANPKYKTDCFIRTERELQWCYIAFKYSAQWSIKRISYVILLDRLYIEWQRVKKDYIWIHLLLLFALFSGVKRNDLFVFKISYQHRIASKKRTLTEMTTSCHSWSLAITCWHSLLLVVPLVVTSCYSFYQRF